MGFNSGFKGLIRLSISQSVIRSASQSLNQ